MNCRVTVAPTFQQELKRLSKRYRSLKDDLARLVAELKDNPRAGIDLGGNLRKVRLAIASKGRGKSGGARVITYTIIWAEVDAEVKLLTIYDKSDRENITAAEMHELMRKNGLG